MQRPTGGGIGTGWAIVKRSDHDQWGSKLLTEGNASAPDPMMVLARLPKHKPWHTSIEPLSPNLIAEDYRLTC
jgi:hypothetical protein